MYICLLLVMYNLIQKTARIAEISTEVTGGGTFYVHSVVLLD